MENGSVMSRRTLTRVVLWLVLLGALLTLYGYRRTADFELGLERYRGQTFTEGSYGDHLQALRRMHFEFLIAIWAGLFLTVIVIYFIQRLDRRGAVEPPQSGPPESRDEEARAGTGAVGGEDAQRHTLHPLILFQREGRLIDFLLEDLRDYDDAQIGAAVRVVHESCQSALKKYFNPQALMEESEGDVVTIEPGFDPNVIKVTGKVSGEPPFRGVLQHRGWRAGHFKIPTLSRTSDPGIIAPAEVEIQ